MGASNLSASMSHLQKTSRGELNMVFTDTFATFLGWCAVLNIGMLSFTTFFVTVLKEPLIKVHRRYFGVDRENLQLVYFQYLGHIKISIFMLNLMPYFALKIIKVIG